MAIVGKGNLVEVGGDEREYIDIELGEDEGTCRSGAERDRVEIEIRGLKVEAGIEEEMSDCHRQ